LSPSVYFNSYHKERENIQKNLTPPLPHTQTRRHFLFFLFALLAELSVGYWKLNRKSSKTFVGHCDSTGDTRDKYTQEDGISSAKMYPQTTEKFRSEDIGTFISEENTYDRCSDLPCFVVLFAPCQFFLVRAFVPPPQKTNLH
jgi:hypothetical protein